jgi:hypothetical protein
MCNFKPPQGLLENINTFCRLLNEANGLMPKRTCYGIMNVTDVDFDIPKEHIRNLFSKANDVRFLCKMNMGRFANFI